MKKKHFSERLKDGYKQRLESKIIRRALQESGRPYVCEICGLAPVWNGKPLTLQVDHIDGNWSDCRKENLRFACPNCHTQAPTFCNQEKGNKCENCGAKISRVSHMCHRCAGLKSAKRKVQNRPAIETLLQEIEQLGYLGTGRKYGVSDNAIRKWIKAR